MFEQIDGYLIRCGYGCGCCEYEEIIRGPFRDRGEVDEKVAAWRRGEGNSMGTSISPDKVTYSVESVPCEILPDGRVIVDNEHVVPGFVGEGKDDEQCHCSW